MKEYTEEEIKEIDRMGRAYGWEVGRGKPTGLILKLSEDNPFIYSNWMDRMNLEQTKQLAQETYPNHSPETALANYCAGRQVWDTNGDLL